MSPSKRPYIKAEPFPVKKPKPKAFLLIWKISLPLKNKLEVTWEEGVFVEIFDLWENAFSLLFNGGIWLLV